MLSELKFQTDPHNTFKNLVYIELNLFGIRAAGIHCSPTRIMHSLMTENWKYPAVTPEITFTIKVLESLINVCSIVEHKFWRCSISCFGNKIAGNWCYVFGYYFDLELYRENSFHNAPHCC